MRTRSAAALAATALVASFGAAAMASASTEPPAGSEPAGTEAAGTEAAGTEAAGTDGAAGGAFVVGSADFPESELLAQIYGQALAAAGFDVSYEPAIGSREAYYGAIESGEINLVPEYTNSLLSFILAPDSPSATNLDEQLAELGENLPDGLEVLAPSLAEDKDVIACTPEVAEEYGLTDLSSLAAASADITIGAPPEFETRTPFGLVGFQELLGAEFGEFVPLSYGDIPAALDEGAIDCGNVFSTSSVVTTSGWVVLDDDAGLVPAENVLPLIRTEVATPDAVAALDEVSAALDTDILKDLVAQVEVDALGPDVVAADWLASDPQPVSAGSEPAGTEAAPAGTEAAGTEAASTEPAGTDAASSEAPATTAA